MKSNRSPLAKPARDASRASREGRASRAGRALLLSALVAAPQFALTQFAVTQFPVTQVVSLPSAAYANQMATGPSARREPTRGLFCTAQGRGIWGGRDVALRYQTSLVQFQSPRLSDSVTLFADESPAANVPLNPDSTLQGMVAYSGTAEDNPSVFVELAVERDLSATFYLTTWQNERVAASGRCEWNYGDGPG
jgi:hypothetical protein